MALDDKKLEDQIRTEFVETLPAMVHVSGSPINPFTLNGRSTVSLNTIEQYRKNGFMLFRKWLRQKDYPLTCLPCYVDAFEFVSWFTQGEHSNENSTLSYSRATYRLYRASLWWWIHEEMPLSPNFHFACCELVEDSSGRHKNYKFDRKKTTALRLKKFPQDDFDLVVNWLENAKRLSIAKCLVNCLKASLLTGLRPHEWKYSAIFDRKDSKDIYRTILAVPNSKHSNGRATGDARLLDITDFHPDDIQIIRNYVDLCSYWGEDWENKDRQMIKAMSQVNKTLWPRRKKVYMLYSCRHQAIANFKTKYDTATIATIVGHGSSNTAGEHYGRKRVGYSALRSIPKPVKGELEKSIKREHARIIKERKKHAGEYRNIRKTEKVNDVHI